MFQALVSLIALHISFSLCVFSLQTTQRGGLTPGGSLPRSTGAMYVPVHVMSSLVLFGELLCLDLHDPVCSWILNTRVCQLCRELRGMDIVPFAEP